MTFSRAAMGADGRGAAGDAVKALVVDDSVVIRSLIGRLLEDAGDIVVVAKASDGLQAIDAVKKHPVDVVVLDIEMPNMDGMTALPKILEARPQAKVIMASTLTTRNAEISIRAMTLGAADYVAKPGSTSEVRSAAAFRRELVDKVRALGRAGSRNSTFSAARATGRPAVECRPFRTSTAAGTRSNAIALRPMVKTSPDILAIGSSTGGPQALLQVLKDLGRGFALPIVITQHMPPKFTAILAKHLGDAVGRPCREAENGEAIRAGHIYVAPGDFHMRVESKGLSKFIVLDQSPAENFCRPSADPMLRSVARVYGGRVLTLILTGMGQDGLKGCEAVIEAGGAVIAQDEASSVVWGMPGAVATKGLCSAVVPLKEIGAQIAQLVGRKAA